MLRLKIQIFVGPEVQTFSNLEIWCTVEKQRENSVFLHYSLTHRSREGPAQTSNCDLVFYNAHRQHFFSCIKRLSVAMRIAEIAFLKMRAFIKNSPQAPYAGTKEHIRSGTAVLKKPPPAGVLFVGVGIINGVIAYQRSTYFFNILPLCSQCCGSCSTLAGDNNWPDLGCCAVHQD